MKMKPMERATVALGTRITPALLNRMEKIARAKDWTTSHLIRIALEEFVAKNGKRKAA